MPRAACGQGAGAGPITLAAQLELPNGHRAITDLGAVRDLAASLAEGVAVHRAELARRLSTTVLVQFDEPVLGAALEGRLTGVTALNPVHPIDEALAITLLDACAAAVGGAALLHTCAGEVPWNVLQRSAIQAVSLDADLLGDVGLDGVGSSSTPVAPWCSACCRRRRRKPARPSSRWRPRRPR